MDKKLNLQDLLDWSHQENFSINLNNEKLSFILAVGLTQQYSDQELTESVLLDLYLSYLLFTGQSNDGAKNKANNLINDLVKQNLFSRFVSNGLEEESIYRLSPLAMGICNHYLRQKEFSKLGLSMQLMVVANEMEKVSNNCNMLDRLHDQDFWKINIFAPLRFSVMEIFDLIDYRQRELDVEQYRIKREIEDLLSKHWHDAINACQELLSKTSLTLKELQHTLAAAGDKLQAQLLKIGETILKTTARINQVKSPAGLTLLMMSSIGDQAALEDLKMHDDREKLLELESILIRTSELLYTLQAKIDRIVGWSQKSIDLWISYDKYVHKFIRSAIDLDKNRVFAQRLSKSISEYLDQPWYLRILHKESLIDLRSEIIATDNQGQVGELPPDIEFEEYKEHEDLLKNKFAQQLAYYRQQKLELNLADFITSQLSSYPAEMHYQVTSTIIGQAMLLGISSLDLQGLDPIWCKVNNYGSEVQSHPIDSF